MNYNLITEENITNLLKRQKQVKPPEALLQMVIDKITSASCVKVPRKSRLSTIYLNIKHHMVISTSISTIVLVLLIAGIVHYNSQPQVIADNTSNASIKSDLQVVDAQLGGLDSDITNIDQELNISD